MEYTKGEWKDEGDGAICAEDGKQIASVFPRDRVANAHLISSAPMMYEALKMYQDHQKDTSGHYCYICAETINNALSKAEGKE